MNKFARILAQLIQERGLNQLQLAALIGVRQSQVSNWLNGKSLPGYHSLDQLRQKLKVNADNFFGGDL